MTQMHKRYINILCVNRSQNLSSPSAPQICPWAAFHRHLNLEFRTPCPSLHWHKPAGFPWRTDRAGIQASGGGKISCTNAGIGRKEILRLHEQGQSKAFQPQPAPCQNQVVTELKDGARSKLESKSRLLQPSSLLQSRWCWMNTVIQMGIDLAFSFFSEVLFGWIHPWRGSSCTSPTVTGAGQGGERGGRLGARRQHLWNPVKLQAFWSFFSSVFCCSPLWTSISGSSFVWCCLVILVSRS